MIPMLDLAWLWNDQNTADVRLALQLVVKQPVAAGVDAASSSNGAGSSTQAGIIPDRTQERRVISIKKEPSQPIDIATSEHCPGPLIVGQKRRAEAQPSDDCVHSAGRVSTDVQQQVLGEDADTPQIEVTHMLHSTIIASASAHFRMQLTTNAEGVERSAGSIKYRLCEQVDPDQVEAAGAVLELMYKHKLPQGLDIPTLLSMLQISERWKAPGCMDAITKALANIPSSSVSLADAAAIFRNPVILRSVPGCAVVLRNAGRILRRYFGDVCEVLFSPSLATSLLKLPHSAVLYLLNSDKLLADCEDSVLVMASWWLEGEVGRSCSEEEVEELQRGIRYSRLSTTYLVQVLRQLPRLRPTERQLLELLGYQALSATLASTYFKDAQDGPIPVGWLKPARDCPDSSSNSVRLSLDVSQADLEKHIAGLKAAITAQGASVFAAEVKSVGKICSGFVVFLYFASGNGALLPSQRNTDPSTGSFISGVEICAPLPGHGDNMSLPRGVACSMTISIQSKTKEYKKSSPESCLCSRVRLHNFPQAVSKIPGDPLALSWWAPLLKNGSLSLSATVQIEV